MAKKEPQRFISTYATIILSDWQALARLMAEVTEEETLDTLSKEQIDDALNGPLGAFYRLKMTMFAKLGRHSHEHTLLKEDIYKEIQDESFASKTVIEIDELFEKLNNLTEGHHKQWQLNWDNWCDFLVTKTVEAGIPLNDIEIAAFKEKETISSLLKRFQELSLEPPKSKIKTMNFVKYLYYKLDIAIQSSLSRLHKQNEQTEIDKILKKMKADFTTVTNSEKQLLATQEEETRMLMGED